MSANPPILTNTNSASMNPSSSTANSNPLRMPNTPPLPTGSSSAGTPASTAASRSSSSSCPSQGGFNGNTKTLYKPKLDTRALAEASKNLTQTLKQLSSEVLTTKSEEVRNKN